MSAQQGKNGGGDGGLSIAVLGLLIVIIGFGAFAWLSMGGDFIDQAIEEVTPDMAKDMLDQSLVDEFNKVYAGEESSGALTDTAKAENTDMGTDTSGQSITGGGQSEQPDYEELPEWGLAEAYLAFRFCDPTGKILDETNPFVASSTAMQPYMRIEGWVEAWDTDSFEAKWIDWGLWHGETPIVQERFEFSAVENIRHRWEAPFSDKIYVSEGVLTSNDKMEVRATVTIVLNGEKIVLEPHSAEARQNEYLFLEKMNGDWQFKWESWKA